MSAWFVYILECNDDTLYTGMTNDLDGRLAKHQSGDGAKYTKSRGARRIIHSEKYKTKSEALKREHEIKKFPRRKKLEIVKSSLT